MLLSFTKDGVTEHLKLSLPDYAAVLVDCLNGTLTLYNHMYNTRLYCGSNFRGLVLKGLFMV